MLHQVICAEDIIQTVYKGIEIGSDPCTSCVHYLHADDPLATLSTMGIASPSISLCLIHTIYECPEVIRQMQEIINDIKVLIPKLKES